MQRFFLWTMKTLIRLRETVRWAHMFEGMLPDVVTKLSIMDGRMVEYALSHKISVHKAWKTGIQHRCKT